jgi:hypothetical protein
VTGTILGWRAQAAIVVAKLDRLSADIAFINELELSRGHDGEH